MRKEDITQEDFDLEEGKMKTIATMFSQGKSAQEIAQKLKVSVDTVKAILGEEQLHEFKKMTVTIQDMDKRKKAIADLMKQNLGVSVTGGVIKVDGKGRDLNNIAKDLMNFYSANVRAESYTIDESADEDFYNPVTEACWVGYKQVGMKNKGGKQVPNCVPESVQEEVDENAPSAADIDRLKKQGMKPKKKKRKKRQNLEKKKEKSDDKEKLKAEIEKKDAEIQSLKVKAETEKAKVAKKETEKMVNPETGEPLLQVGIAYKHMRDKMKKEKMQEDADYLKPKMNPSQLANIKNVWKHKTKKDVTPAVQKMIKNMDIPTQLAIKQAKINVLSDLVEMAKDKAYAIGMATAKKKYNDEATS